MEGLSTFGWCLVPGQTGALFGSANTSRCSIHVSHSASLVPLPAERLIETNVSQAKRSGVLRAGFESPCGIGGSDALTGRPAMKSGVTTTRPQRTTAASMILCFGVISFSPCRVSGRIGRPLADSGLEAVGHPAAVSLQVGLALRIVGRVPLLLASHGHLGRLVAREAREDVPGGGVGGERGGGRQV